MRLHERICTLADPTTHALLGAKTDTARSKVPPTGMNLLTIWLWGDWQPLLYMVTASLSLCEDSSRKG